MEKSLIAVTFASLLMAGAAQATDHSASIDISGTAIGSPSECSVYATPSITLTGAISKMPTQGDDSTDPTVINYSIGSNSDPSCLDNIAIIVTGTADDADQTTIANTDKGANAAKGVGIGLYDSALKPLKINESTLSSATNMGQINLQLVKLKGQTQVEGTVHGSLTLEITHI